MSENIEHSEFKTFLSKVDLHEKCCNFLTNGITRIEHLQDIKEDDIGQLNLTVFEWRRLQREVTAWKSKVSTKETAADKPGFKTSSASEIIALPKAFRDSFHTRDGKGHIVVSVEQLKRKFKNLWYELPLNPSQVFSNSVILKMAQERMQHEKSLRACEMWCRAQRKKRTVVMLAAAQKPVISKWTHYFKSQSIVGLCEIADVQYPAVVDFMKIKKDKSCIPPKALYEMFGLYLVLLEEASAFSDDALGKCNQYVTDCLIGGGETPKRGYKSEYNFFSNEALPALQIVDGVVKEKVAEANDILEKAREKYGYCVEYKKAKRKAQKRKAKAKRARAETGESSKECSIVGVKEAGQVAVVELLAREDYDSSESEADSILTMEEEEC